jgi:hypothetical protein
MNMTNKGIITGYEVYTSYIDEIDYIDHTKALEAWVRIARGYRTIIPNHEYRVWGIGEKYCFGTAPLVTPKLKSYLAIIPVKGIKDTVPYIKPLNGYHTIQYVDCGDIVDI